MVVILDMSSPRGRFSCPPTCRMPASAGWGAMSAGCRRRGRAFSLLLSLRSGPRREGGQGVVTGGPVVPRRRRAAVRPRRDRHRASTQVLTRRSMSWSCTGSRDRSRWNSNGPSRQACSSAPRCTPDGARARLRARTTLAAGPLPPARHVPSGSRHWRPGHARLPLQRHAGDLERSRPSPGQPATRRRRLGRSRCRSPAGA